MRKSIFKLVFFLFLSANVFSQTLADLKLKPKEIPKSYTLTDSENCISFQACNFYKQVAMYSPYVGKVKNKEVQHFESKNGSGTIMYFEFEYKFKGEGFLEGLLWGNTKKPSVEHPEEYFVKGNLLVIWSFKSGSQIKKISEDKVKGVLK